jgi:hypothetical protein
MYLRTCVSLGPQITNKSQIRKVPRLQKFPYLTNYSSPQNFGYVICGTACLQTDLDLQVLDLLYTNFHTDEPMSRALNIFDGKHR